VTGGTPALLVALALSDRMTIADAAAAVAAIVLLGQRLVYAGFGAGNLYESALFIRDIVSFLELERPARPELNGDAAPAPAGAPARRRAARPDRAALRRRAAVIFQDFIRYALPARDNIALGRHERGGDEAAIRAAARQAGAHEDLERLPDGYATMLGPAFEGGTDLSLGQWQRLALARVFFRDAPFVILDEPTAALDARAEAQLFEAIRTLLAGRSVLLISHRFSSVRTADWIYLLHDGRITEAGTHTELMDAGGRCCELFSLQAAAYR
jgi:energy-coupling factor transporter ATP-binding protein EcfA2